MPTPAIAYLTRAFRAEAGVVISASHNPFYDNGIKFFSIEGTKLPDDVEEAIEAQKLGATYISAGHIFATDCKKDLPPRGLEFLKN